MNKAIIPVGFTLCAVVLALTLGGCESEKPATTQAPASTAAPPTPPPAPATLFERLGGKEGLNAVMDVLINNIGHDSRVRGYFTGVDITRFKAKMAEYLCQQTGGPCQYTGIEIKTAHMSLQVTAPAFDAMMEDITKSLDEKQVSPADKAEVLEILGKVKSDIVATYGGSS